ncbi:pentapeptide repeat-containing protein [Streptomyces sp. NPDC048641]|uniref:pentapeptide repeat-containing protein n=1 Tax=unclassified Streptomyces TaxID=2593676 RepID=UPI003428636F
MSATADVHRVVRVPPADPEASAVLASWARREGRKGERQEESPLDVSGLDLSGADLCGLDRAMGLFCGTVLRDTRLGGTDLYRAHMEGAVLAGADLSRACLTKTVLDEADLRGATAAEANLGSAELYGVDARGASFRGARLNGASFLDARLEGADLTGASVRETSLKAALDGRNRVEGLTGTVSGPARLEGSGSSRELAGDALERRPNERGASVEVLHSAPRCSPPPSTTPTSTSPAR